ncbi:peptide-methionine (R)-S-oxide reductase MsrB [Gracilimonas sp.]|uniref:peptide-methionine (R)-S-oxide reductase MsrB n=1 Tax=Gracilimonas sp. TaxID=1974203 RepID=UPI0028727BC9|nr:peptide-methionine (R)-S-oxide reductase MsrB [Gracilimonas sp.]
MKYAAIFGILFLTTVLVIAINKPDDSIKKVPGVPIHATAVNIADNDTLPEGGGDFTFKRSDTEWKEILTSKEYRILRGGGTELPYVNEYDNNKEKGIYVCAGCGQKLYSSEHKYDSGTGWPSYWRPIADSLVEERIDKSFFMTRIEIVCSNCGGHLGHVFDDGPQPTGLRYCMNSAAMDFIKAEDERSN